VVITDFHPQPHRPRLRHRVKPDRAAMEWHGRISCARCTRTKSRSTRFHWRKPGRMRVRGDRNTSSKFIPAGQHAPLAEVTPSAPTAPSWPSTCRVSTITCTIAMWMSRRSRSSRDAGSRVYFNAPAKNGGHRVPPTSSSRSANSITTARPCLCPTRVRLPTRRTGDLRIRRRSSYHCFHQAAPGLRTAAGPRGSQERFAARAAVCPASRHRGSRPGATATKLRRKL
jgi:hypothetical protein